jgi:hypothetical protein
MNTKLSRRTFLALAISSTGIATLLPSSISSSKNEKVDRLRDELICYFRWKNAYLRQISPNEPSNGEYFDVKLVVSIDPKFESYRYGNNKWYRKIEALTKESRIDSNELLLISRQIQKTILNLFDLNFADYGPISKAALAKLYYIDNVDNQPDDLLDRHKILLRMFGKDLLPSSEDLARRVMALEISFLATCGIDEYFV